MLSGNESHIQWRQTTQQLITYCNIATLSFCCNRPKGKFHFVFRQLLNIFTGEMFAFSVTVPITFDPLSNLQKNAIESAIIKYDLKSLFHRREFYEKV